MHSRGSPSSIDLLSGLSSVQRAIVEHPALVRQVIAAAGSGKTRTVIALAEYAVTRQGIAPDAVLFLSFSRKAVAEIRARLPLHLADRLEVSTFHSFCYRHLPEVDASVTNGIRVLAEEEREAFLRKQMVALGGELDGTPYELLLRRPDLFRATFPNAAMRVFRALHEHKRATGQLEYEDLIERMVNRIAVGTPETARLRARYRLIIVDEFQDTDPAQVRFLKLMRPERLVVVGDDWQAIYGFRGADVRPFLEFPRHFKGAARLRLGENYRSLRPITELGARIIRASSRKLRKKVKAIRGSAPRPGLPAVSLELPLGQEQELLERLPKDCDAIMLVRSNFRRRLWLQAGFPEERVLTIHAAKGLEFPVVFVDLMAGWAGRGGQANPDEELRVAYVAVTRAMNLVCVLRTLSYRAGDSAGLIVKAALPGLRTVRTEGLVELISRELEFRNDCTERRGA